MSVKRVQRPLSLLSVLAFLVGSSCSSTPVPETAVGIRTEVVILGGGFVRFEGDRVPMESFVYEVRVRVREADGDETRFPWVVIDVDPAVAELTGQAMVQKLMNDLRAAGVAHIEAGPG